MKTSQSPKCPDCGAQMVKRHSKKFSSDFWGCSTFPKCRGTRQLSEAGRPTKPTKNITPSRYQVAIFQHVQDRNAGNLVVKATAGSGKTTTVEHASFLLPRNLDIAYVVYNAHVRDAAIDRMPAWVDVLTSHSLGYRNLADYLGHYPKLDDDKVYRTLRTLLDATWMVDSWLVSPVKAVVGHLKNRVMEPVAENIGWIAERYGIEMNGHFDRIVKLCQEVLRIGNKDLEVIDYDDMIYLVIYHQMPCRQYDILLLDEVQDFNQGQIRLVLRSIKPDGRVIAVGDEDQSMYGFRGADTEAMQRVQEALKAEVLPLSITYRCPRSGVRLVNSIFPDIAFEAAPNAIEGELISVSEDRMLGEVRDGDMVLCRTNAPLVSPCFELIRRGVKAVIRGRDIGKGLISLVEKFRTSDLEDLLTKLAEYEDNEVSKLMAANKNTQAQNLEDKIETIFALAEGCREVGQVITKIDEVFTNEKEGVVFSTVHKAKGLESDNVYILEPSLMPHPMAAQDWEVRQERNILFVALTRAKVRLAFIGAVPYGGSMMWDEGSTDESEVEEDPSSDQAADSYVQQRLKGDYWSGRHEKEEIPDCPF